MRITVGMAAITLAVLLVASIGSAQAGMTEGFESYAPGSYPSANWTSRFSGVSQYVSDAVAYEGNQSFRLQGGPSWAAESYRLVEKPLTPTWSVQAAMRVDVWSGGGDGGGIWSYTTLNGEHLFGVGYGGVNGTLYPRLEGGGAVDFAHPISLGVWYFFGVEVDENAGSVDYYITQDGGTREPMFIGLPLVVGDPSRSNRFIVHGGQSCVNYFDALAVFPEPTTAAICALGGGLLLLKRRR